MEAEQRLLHRLFLEGDTRRFFLKVLAKAEARVCIFRQFCITLFLKIYEGYLSTHVNKTNRKGEINPSLTWPGFPHVIWPYAAGMFLLVVKGLGHT